MVIREHEIGSNIKKFRKLKKLTMQELADVTGYSKGYISRVEKSEKSPPVSTLAKIAKALNITISQLLGEEERTDSISFVKQNERALIMGQGTPFGHQYESIAYRFPNRTMQPYVLTISPNMKQRVLFQHDSEEMVFVIKGTMRFTYGEKEYIVETGDAIYFDGNVPHFGEAHGDEECVSIIVMSNE